MASRTRYSTMVTWTKVILPMVALGLLSTLFLFSRVPDPEQAIPFASVDVEELARDQRIGQPRFAGTLEDGREIILTASQARPVPGNINQIDAEGINLRLDLRPEAVVLMSSAAGLIDLGAQTADLRDAVTLSTSDGYRLVARDLTISLAVLSAVSTRPVEITGPGMEITAGRMEISQAGSDYLVVFNGGVRVLYDPQS